MDGDQVTARPASLSDVAVLVELMHEFYAESGFALDSDSAAHAFHDLLANPAHGGVWLMTVGDQIAGHVVLSVRFAMEFGGISAYIDDLFVRPAYRRGGVGRAGLDALLAECLHRGCKSLQVEVDPQNVAANALYQRVGLLPLSDGRQTLRMPLEPGV